LLLLLDKTVERAIRTSFLVGEHFEMCTQPVKDTEGTLGHVAADETFLKA
jgi:hypothetical protein